MPTKKGILRVQHVKRNYDGSVAEKGPPGFFPIIKNPETRETAAVDLASADITMFHLDLRKKVVLIQFVLGGYDADGEFHASPDFKPAAWRLTRLQNPEAFDNLVKGKRVWNLDDLLKYLQIHKKQIMDQARHVWGLEGFETETDDDPIPEAVGVRERPAAPPDTTPVRG